MKLYKARNGEDNLIEGKFYIGFRSKDANTITLTHVVSSDRKVQLNQSITTATFNLVVMADNADLSFDTSAKAIPRGNRGVR